MSDMNTKDEPQPLGTSVAPLMARLRARGYDPASLPPRPAELAETREEAQERAKRRVESYQARWDRLVPPIYAQAAVEDLDEAQDPARVRGWLHSGSLHLVLAGPVGTGKTHAAYAVANQALSAGLWTEAWNVGDLLDACRPASGDRDAERRARECRVLVLDDLLAKASDWEAERMTLLLDARVRAELQTIVTTNITAPQVADVWGHRFMDRLRYRLTTVNITGESRRGGAW